MAIDLVSADAKGPGLVADHALQDFAVAQDLRHGIAQPAVLRMAQDNSHALGRLRGVMGHRGTLPARLEEGHGRRTGTISIANWSRSLWRRCLWSGGLREWKCHKLGDLNEQATFMVKNASFEAGTLRALFVG